MKNLILFFSILIGSLSLNAQTAEEYHELAKIKFEEQDFKYALTLIEKSLAIDSSDVWTRLFSSTINMELKRPKAAILDVYKAIEIDSTVSENYNRLGNICLSLNMLDESVLYFAKAIDFAEADSVKFSYYLNSATAKGVLRDFKGSLNDFEKGYKIDSNNIVLLNNLAAVYQ